MEKEKRQKNHFTPFVKSGTQNKLQIELEKTRKWVKQNLPPSKYKQIDENDKLEYIKKCHAV